MLADNEITKEDFAVWWTCPVGRKMRETLEARILELNEMALSVPCVRDSVSAAIYLGRKWEIQEVLTMTFEQMMGIEEKA